MLIVWGLDVIFSQPQLLPHVRKFVIHRQVESSMVGRVSVELGTSGMMVLNPLEVDSRFILH